MEGVRAMRRAATASISRLVQLLRVLLCCTKIIMVTMTSVVVRVNGLVSVGDGVAGGIVVYSCTGALTW